MPPDHGHHGQNGNQGNQDNQDNQDNQPVPDNGPPAIPPGFDTILVAAPQDFVVALDDDHPGGQPWSAVEVSDDSGLYSTSPSELFLNIAMPPGQAQILFQGEQVGFVNASAAPVVVDDDSPLYQYIVTNGAGLTLFDQAPSGAFVAEGGDNMLILAPSGMQQWTITLAGGNNTVFASSGDDTITTGSGQNIVVLGSGNDIVYSLGHDLLVAGAGDDTIDALGPGATVFGGSGQLTFIDGNTVPGGSSSLIIGGQGQITAMGGAGNVTVFGGSGGGTYFGGSAGNNLMVGGSGHDTFVGGGSGDLIFGGVNGGDLLVAGAGNETLVGSLTHGGNVFDGGTGNDVIVSGAGNNTVNGGAAGTSDVIFGGPGNVMVNGNGANLDFIAGTGTANIQAGSGTEMFQFVNGQAGGSAVITGFNTATDTLALSGYSAAPTVTSAGGSTTVTLVDNTRITLVGVSHLPASAIT